MHSAGCPCAGSPAISATGKRFGLTRARELLHFAYALKSWHEPTKLAIAIRISPRVNRPEGQRKPSCTLMVEPAREATKPAPEASTTMAAGSAVSPLHPGAHPESRGKRPCVNKKCENRSSHSYIPFYSALMCMCALLYSNTRTDSNREPRRPVRSTTTARPRRAAPRRGPARETLRLRAKCTASRTRSLKASIEGRTRGPQPTEHSA